MLRTRMWCAALVNGFRPVPWQAGSETWEPRGGYSSVVGCALVQVLTNSLSSDTCSLKLVAPLLALVVALPPQLRSLYFCICSGLENTCCHHVLYFVFSHRLLMLIAAHTC